MAHDVFISYSSVDKTTGLAVCAYLERAGIRCWIAPRDIVPGQAYGAAIVDALNGCEVLVLVFSQSADASPHVNREVERAVSKGAVIVPFRIENVRPSAAMEYFISSEHWLDALDPPLEGHLARLVETVSRLVLKKGERLAAGEAAKPKIDAACEQEFEELAPDEWRTGPRRERKGVAGFLRKLFAEE